MTPPMASIIIKPAVTIKAQSSRLALLFSPAGVGECACAMMSSLNSYHYYTMTSYRNSANKGIKVSTATSIPYLTRFNYCEVPSVLLASLFMPLPLSIFYPYPDSVHLCTCCFYGPRRSTSRHDSSSNHQDEAWCRRS